MLTSNTNDLISTIFSKDNIDIIAQKGFTEFFCYHVMKIRNVLTEKHQRTDLKIEMRLRISYQFYSLGGLKIIIYVCDVGFVFKISLTSRLQCIQNKIVDSNIIWSGSAKKCSEWKHHSLLNVKLIHSNLVQLQNASFSFAFIVVFWSFLPPNSSWNFRFLPSR